MISRLSLLQIFNVGNDALSGGMGQFFCKKKANRLPASPFSVGRSERIRTSDPHNPIVVRYQAALRSVKSGHGRRSREECQHL